MTRHWTNLKLQFFSYSLSALCCFIVGCASASKIGVSVAREGEVIKIITTNISNDPLTLYNPDKLVALQGDPGLEIKVFDRSNKEVKPCSITEPGYSNVDKPTYLSAKQSIARPLSIKLIKMMYCLSPGGPYGIQAILHPGINSDVQYVSKKFEFWIARD